MIDAILLSSATEALYNDLSNARRPLSEAFLFQRGESFPEHIDSEGMNIHIMADQRNDIRKR